MKAINNKKELFELYNLYLNTLYEVHYNNIVIEKKDIHKLLPNQYLNDTLINFYFQIMKNYAILKNKNIYVFTTFFFTKLCRDYEETINLYPIIDLSKYDLLFIPIHKNSHWTLMVYIKKYNMLEYFDSLNGKLNINQFKKVRDFLYDLGNKSNYKISIKFINHPICSQQNNGFDCGIFICQYLKCKILEIPCIIIDTNSKNIRMKMLHEIVSIKILYEPNHKFKEI